MEIKQNSKANKKSSRIKDLLVTMKSNRLSLIVSVILVIAVVVIRLTDAPVKMLTWDVFGYYLYLPAHFIYDDPALTNHQWLDDIIQKYQPSPTLYQLVDLDNGSRLIKYSSGMAVLYSPFFFLAHWLAPVLGYPADGFSLPYQVILSLGGILWALAGIFLYRKLLLKFFNDRITALMLVLTIAGTNYFHLVSLDGTLLTHNYLFTLYVLLILYTINWHSHPTLSKAISIGLVGGLISLIRPSEAVCFLIPLLWSTGTKQAFNSKLEAMKKFPLHLVMILFVALIIGSVQFFYWKSLTGQWLYYSYSNNAGEGFRFFPPYIMEFLFSFRKGWLLYTPIMIGSIIGLYVMIRKHRENAPAIIAYLVITLWIISAWTAWWYGGGSFSSRSIIPAYALLAIPFGYLVVEINATRWKWPAIFVASFLVLLNLFQSWQWESKIIDKERMTKEYYLAIFGKTKVDREKVDHLLLVDRSTETDEVPQHLERYVSKVVFESKPVLSSDTAGAAVLNGANQFFPGPDLMFKDITDSDHVWIKSSVEIWLPEQYQGSLPKLVMAFHYKGEAYKYRAVTIDESRVVTGSWIPLSYWYLSPEVRTNDDNLKVYVWHTDSSPIYVRNLKVEACELKML